MILNIPFEAIQKKIKNKITPTGVIPSTLNLCTSYNLQSHFRMSADFRKTGKGLFVFIS